jgi:citronellol/citronellal dehydrogenase
MQRLSLISEHVSKQTNKPLSGKTVVITGASRGIGLAIGLRCAKDGANVAILAKTTTPQPTL